MAYRKSNLALLLRPANSLSSLDAFNISKMTKSYLANLTKPSASFPFSLIGRKNLNYEDWVRVENILINCLRVGDDVSAQAFLRLIINQFGRENERVMALQGIYDEAVAKDNQELEVIKMRYESIIRDNSTNIQIRKRLATLLVNLCRPHEAIAVLCDLVSLSPIDSEAWAELADLYFDAKDFAKAVYCLEEVLLISPNSWNTHAQLGECLYAFALQSPIHSKTYLENMSGSLRRFCRSIELCTNYLRGYYGLKLTAKQLLRVYNQKPPGNDVKSSTDIISDVNILQTLDEQATVKLTQILQMSKSSAPGWDGYIEAELALVQNLLSQDEVVIVR